MFPPSLFDGCIIFDASLIYSYRLKKRYFPFPKIVGRKTERNQPEHNSPFVFPFDVPILQKAASEAKIKAEQMAIITAIGITARSVCKTWTKPVSWIPLISKSTSKKRIKSAELNPTRKLFSLTPFFRSFIQNVVP